MIPSELKNKCQKWVVRTVIQDEIKVHDNKRILGDSRPGDSPA